MRNHSYENEFHLQVHFHAKQTYFLINLFLTYLNGFALRLVLKQRHKGTRKWPIKIIQLGIIMTSESKFWLSEINEIKVMRRLFVPTCL